MAAGLSVIFGVMDVLNLAHGSFYMLGAYVGLAVLAAVHSFWVALIVAPVALAVLGAGLEVLFFRRLYRRGHLMQVLLTFGFTLVFVDLVRWRFGPTAQSIATPAGLGGHLTLAGANFSAYRFFVLLVAGVVAAAMILAWRRLRIGTILRAGVADSEMVGLLGIDLRLVFTLTFALGAALAGLAGVLAGPFLSVYPGMDENVLVLALVVVVIGGLGSIEGAFMVALLVGVVTSLGSYYLPGLAVMVVFALMALVLLVRPRGLFGLRA
jgi:branched-subunit amino acid ABC-type transport system permease component